MKGNTCALFGGLLKKNTAAMTLFALLTTFFLLAPAQTGAKENFVKSFDRQKSEKLFASNTVVISQFQVAGGTAADEFVELHNVSGSDVDLNGYRLVYRSAAGTSDVTVASWAASTIIPAGGYYLIAHATGYDGATSANVTYNAGSTGSFSGTSGGFALRSGEPNTGTIIDSVGYGSATNAFVETATTSVPAANAAKARGGEGCADTDNNSSDFVTVSPSAPRNSGSAVNICGGAGGAPSLSISNITLTEGNSGTKTFSFTVSLSAPVAENVTFDIATADGTATVADNDYIARSLTGQSIAAGSRSYTFDVTVNGDTNVEPTEEFSVNVTNVTGITVADGTGTGTITTDDVSTAPTASGAANPSTVQAGGMVLLTVTVSLGTNPASTGITVTGNLTSIGGASAQTFFDDGTNGDATAGDNVFSYLATVVAGTTNGGKTLPVTITDAQSRTRNINISLTVGTTSGTHSPEEHLIMGNPSNATTDVNNPLNYLMLKEQYALSYNRDRATPNWVSWHLDSTWLGSAPRQDDFRPDPTLPADWYRVSGSSYSGSGFDRGHHTPSADRTSSVPDNSATFLMTNMMPQAPGNNQGPWERLESYSRTQVTAGNELYVVMGGVGTGGTGDNGFANTIDNGRVTVPAYTWKVIIILPVGENDVSRVNSSTRTIGVIMPNDTSIRPDQWQKYITTVDIVESLTGYDFFSNVDPAIQAAIESRIDPANNVGPTAANVSVSGRVATQSGRGVRNVQITLTDGDGNRRTAQTTTFGYYRFDNVGAGETVVLSGRAKRYTFVQSSLVRTITEQVSDADFVVVD